MRKVKLLPGKDGGTGRAINGQSLFLTSRPRAGGTVAWCFQPPTRDRSHGWLTILLRRDDGSWVVDRSEAERRAAPLAHIYYQWKAGVAGYAPHLIDKWGRVVDPKRRAKPAVRYLPGQVGAMVHDFLHHHLFKARKPKTQIEYRTYLNVFVEKFGAEHWRDVSPAKLRRWLEARGEHSGYSGAKACARTIRSFFSYARLMYEPDHPGYVAMNDNPAGKLRLPEKQAMPLAWPKEAVRAMVELCDAEGEHSMGDAITFMAWLGVRRQDWLYLPVDRFYQSDRVVSFQQAKTGWGLALPWGEVPELAQRIEAAKLRREQRGILCPYFFTTAAGAAWVNHRYFWQRFIELRDRLAARRAWFATGYHVGLVEGQPMALPTSALQIRTLRHTCVTLNFDAGLTAQQVASITGHTTKEVEEILARYRARTVDQAKKALRFRIVHESDE